MQEVGTIITTPKWAKAAAVAMISGVLVVGLSGCGGTTSSASQSTSGQGTSTQSSSTPSTSSSSTSASTATPQGKTVQVTMKIVDGKLNGVDQPRYTNADWSVVTGGTIAVGNTVDLTIISYDDGPAPPPAGFDKVQGTIGGTETVDGKVVSDVALKDISHTFTISQLGINLPIPVAPTGGSVTVKAAIHLTKAGTFNWQCFAPCGSGASGWKGAMVTDGWMRGSITVAPS